MDAFELTRPILSDGRRITVERHCSAGAPADLRASARRFVNQLPLGSWSGPAFDGVRWNPRAASRETELALFRTAASAGVAVDVDDSPDAIARRRSVWETVDRTRSVCVSDSEAQTLRVVGAVTETLRRIR